MTIRYSLMILAFTGLSSLAVAQSETTEALNKKYPSQSLFLYHNTLRMLNQKEDPAFDALIKDVEKIKFLMIRKDGQPFDYKKIISDYKAEKFEEAMSSRHQGKSFDIFLKGNNKTSGMLVLVNDAETLMVLDIVGTIALDQVTKLYDTIGESSEMGKRIRDFVQDDKDKKDESDN